MKNAKPCPQESVEVDGHGFFTPFPSPVYGDDVLRYWRVILDANCIMMMPFFVPFLGFAHMVRLATPLWLR